MRLRFAALKLSKAFQFQDLVVRQLCQGFDRPDPFVELIPTVRIEHSPHFTEFSSVAALADHFDLVVTGFSLTSGT
jgi:hypothetical protein